MSRRQDEYMRGFSMKPYDLIREGVLALAVVAVLVIVLAVIFGSPSAPTVRGEDVAKAHPLDFLKTATDFSPVRAASRPMALPTPRIRTTS